MSHAATIALIRDVANAMGCPVAILGDLQGRHSIGDLPAPRMLTDGSDIVLVPEHQEQGDRFRSRTPGSPTMSTSAIGF
jgi:pyruvate kinase